MVVERRPRPRVRVFRLLRLPIPPGYGSAVHGRGLALLVRRTTRNPAGRDMDQMSSRDRNSSAGRDALTYGAGW
jgi:hypothetical protein